MIITGTFRIIVKQDFESPDLEHAKQIGQKLASKIFKENKEFIYVELAETEKAENQNHAQT